MRSPGALGPAAALSILILLPACSADLAGGGAAPAPPPAGPAPAAAAPPEAPPKLVRVVMPVAAGAGGDYPSALYVERDVRVTARRSGVLEKILADRGKTVKEGEPLALLETDLAARDLELAEQEVRLSQAELDRLKPLIDQRIVSPQDYQRAEIARDQAATKAALARAWLDRCTVRAPFDGVVVDRWAVTGQRVREEDAVPLFRIVARDPLRARADVPGARLARLAPGGRASIEMAGGRIVPARIVFVSPALDPASDTAAVIVETSPANEALRPGAPVTVRLETPEGGGPRAWLLPREAFPAGAAEGRDTRVMVVSAGRARSRALHVAGERGGLFEVRGDLAAGEGVIVSGGSGIVEGDSVVPKEPE